MAGCSGNQVRYSDPVEILFDNFWINDDLLQIQVESGSSENIPFTMRKDTSCAKAKEMIDTRLNSLYPSMKGLSYRVNIYKTMYHKKMDCQLVVHISMPGLRKKITQGVSENTGTH
ncbi:MAG: hypothetical protein OEV66_11660 [Spirochaetia bacterium]|nr:hypothetical protein [Spirochaetia bacterium]